MTIKIQQSQANRPGDSNQSVGSRTSLCCKLGTGAVGFNIYKHAKFTTRSTTYRSAGKQCFS
jgi:hypothetical protein